MSEKPPVKKIFDFSLLRRVFSFAGPYRKSFFLSLGMAIFLAVLSPVRPYLIQLTVNDYVKGGAAVTGTLKSPFIRLIIQITIWQAVLLLFETAIRFYFSYITALVGQSVVKDLRVKVFSKII